MRKLITFLLLLTCFSAEAATRISLTITVTNIPVTGNSNTINGSLRQWTNSSSASTILTNLVGIGPSTTNLFNNYASFPVGSGITHRMTASNVVVFTAPLGVSLSGSSVGGWASSVLSTQSGPSTFTALWPMENMVGETNRTNQGSSLVYGLGIYSTNAFPTNATALTNFITKGATVGPQYISSELRLSGNLNNGANRLGVSNLINYGSAIRSEGSGGNSLQVGSNAVASGVLSMAIGNGASALTNNATAVGNSSIALGFGSVALGQSSVASNNFATAIGQAAFAGYYSVALGQGAIATNHQTISIGVAAEGQGTNSIAIGTETGATGVESIAIGASAQSSYERSVSIGYQASATSTNQIRLGTTSETVSVPGMLESGTITNATLRGTNIINGQTVYTPTSNSGLANGYNSAVAINAAYVRFSGPSGAYTNVGFSAANKMDGKRHLCQFDNPGLSFTILHDSGLDAGATNRIYTGTGALLNSTNNPAFAEIIYDDNATRWRVISFR